MKDHIISEDARIVEALDALNKLSGDTMTLFVTDGGGRLLGSLTDGDVRRALLSGHTLSDPVAGICNRNCLFLNRAERDGVVIAEARRKGVSLLPVVEEGTIVSLIDLRKQRGLIPADGVLMAGGAGERLRPLTLHTPKPLLPVGGTPIIDLNVALMQQFGIERIFVTVNYLKESIRDYFDGNKTVTCVEEPFKMGTIGSLSLIDGFESPNILVMNADLLTDINLEAMYLKHLETEAWLTMGAIPYTVSVPYAILEHHGDAVAGLTEKPTYNYYANAGIYLLKKEALKYIPKGEYMDATDLIERLISDGKRVSLFNIEGRWIDIGSPDDYRHACEIMK